MPSIATASAGADHRNITIENNDFSKMYYGIYIYGSSSSRDSNITITKNSIGSNTATDYVTYQGIVLYYTSTATISENTVFNIITAEAPSPAMRGIRCEVGVINSTISVILFTAYDIQEADSDDSQGISCISGASYVPANITIVNNIVYDLKGQGSGTRTSNAWGIIIFDGGGYNVYSNTISLSGTQRHQVQLTSMEQCW